jgi:hypothetical protein
MSRDRLAVRTFGASYLQVCRVVVYKPCRRANSSLDQQTLTRISAVLAMLSMVSSTPSNEPLAIPPCLFATLEAFLDIGGLGKKRVQRRLLPQVLEIT